MEELKLGYRVIYGNCLPIDDVVSVLDMIHKTNNLGNKIDWRDPDSARSTIMTRQELVNLIINRIRTSLIGHANNGTTIDASATTIKNTGGL
jgi:hypothetical protein